MSAAALVDSRTATSSPALTRLPTGGSSTKTTCPSSFWAWSVIPTVPTPSSTRIHSCESVNLIETPIS